MVPTAFDTFVDKFREDFDMSLDGVREGNNVIQNLFHATSQTIDLSHDLVLASSSLDRGGQAHSHGIEGYGGGEGRTYKKTYTGP